MGLSRKDIVYLILAFVGVFLVWYIVHISSNYIVEERRLKKYVLETYNKEYEITAIGLLNDIQNSDNLHHFKGYFEDEPLTEVQFDVVGNEFSKYYWSKEKSDWYYGDYFNNYIDMYYGVISARFRLSKGNMYQHLEPSLAFDDAMTYLIENNRLYNLLGEFVIDCTNMTKDEIEELGEILYQDFVKEGFYFDFTLTGKISETQTVKIHMTHQKWLSLNESKIRYEYSGIN